MPGQGNALAAATACPLRQSTAANRPAGHTRQVYLRGMEIGSRRGAERIVVGAGEPRRAPSAGPLHGGHAPSLAVQAAAAALRGEALPTFDGAVLRGPVHVGGLHPGAHTAPDIEPDLSMHVPVAKARAVRRAVIERRIHANEWHGAEIETPDMAQEAQREAQREKSAARTQAQRQREERRQSVLQRIQEDEAPLMPRRPMPPQGAGPRRDSSIMMRASADEHRLASQVARLLGRTNRYVSPGGVVNLAQRTTTARLLHLLRFHGIRKDGTRFSPEELRTRSEAMRLGSLPSAQLPYRTADELRVAPSVLKTLPRSSAAALISAGVAATAGRRGNPSRAGRAAEGQAPLGTMPSGTSSMYLDQPSPARGQQGEDGKMAVRRARLERRKRRRRVAARARQAALASAGSVAATARLPPTTTLLLHLRQEEDDDGDMDVLSEGGISSGDSDDSAVVRAMAAPVIGSRRHQPAFGLMPGAANLRTALAQSQARLARTRTGATSGRREAPHSPGGPGGQAYRRHRAQTPAASASPRSGESPSQASPPLIGGGDSSALRAWASLERQLEVGSGQGQGGAGALAVSAGAPWSGGRVPRLPLGATTNSHSQVVHFQVSTADSISTLADPGFAFSDAHGAGSGPGASPSGGGSPRGRRHADQDLAGPRESDVTDGHGDDEAARRSFRDGFVPEWLRRAVEEARSLPDFLQLEGEAWATGSHSASASVSPAECTLRFAFKVFRPMFDGGVGAGALAGSRGLALALAGAGPSASLRQKPGSQSSSTKVDATGKAGAPVAADAAGDFDEQAIEDELVDTDLSGRNAAHALAARGMPTREPSPEPYLPLTDRRPVRAPARAATLERELRVLSAKAEASLRVAEAQAALEQGRSANLDVQAHVDTQGVDATPRMLSSGHLVRTPLQAAAAADQARQWRLDARVPQSPSKAGYDRSKTQGAASSSPASGANVDTHGAFIEVQGRFFSIPQAIMDEAASALLKRESDGVAPGALPPAGAGPIVGTGARGDNAASGVAGTVSGRASVESGSSVQDAGSAPHFPAGRPQRSAQTQALAARPSRPKASSVASSTSAEPSQRWSGQRGSTAESKEASNGQRARPPATARPPRPGVRLVPPGKHGSASPPMTARPGVDTSPVRAAAAPLGSLAQSTKASWSGWRRAPVRPVVERARRGGVRGSRKQQRSERKADLAHFAPELAGKSLKDLGAGDLFELARLEGDRKLARLVESVETSRGQAQELRASAVERQLSCASIANLTEEAMPLIRADAEIARTIQAELQASGTAWFTDLLRALAGMQTRKDILPVQLLLLAQAREEFQRGRQPGAASLRSVFLRITRDEFASPVAQLLFAFFRRLARIPLEEWRELAAQCGMPRPAEVFIADALAARSSPGHLVSARSRYPRSRE